MEDLEIPRRKPLARVKVNEQGRIVIPAPFRERLGIQPGDTIILIDQGDHVELTTSDLMLKQIQAAWAAVVPPGYSVADELIRERRAEAARDAAEEAAVEADAASRAWADTTASH
jgi:AbrB family looped-hinge helix DNA binding protein